MNAGRADGLVAGDGRSRRAGLRSRSTDVRQPPIERGRVAVDGPAAEPGRAGPAVPGDDPVVEREAERRQVLVVGGDRRQPLERVAQVVAEVADEAAEERRHVAVGEVRFRRPGREAGHEPAGGRERVGAGRGPVEDLDGVGREERPAGAAAGPGALEEREPGQAAERLGDVDRADRGELRQRDEADERGSGDGAGTVARGVDHRAIIGGTPEKAGRRPRCARGISGSSSVAAGPGRTTRSPTSPASAWVTRRSSAATGRWSSARARSGPASRWSSPTTATSSPSRSSPAATASTATAS